MNNLKSLNYTCLFGGGAIRGAAHVGVLKAFDELGVNCSRLGGSSVGSIIATLKAVGYTSEELENIFLSVNFELFKDISFAFNSKFGLSKGEVFLDWFRELIEKKFYANDYKKGQNKPVKFADLDKDLFIISTNMRDFTCCEFSKYETPDFEIAMAVRISCCAPGLMGAVNIDEKLLVDGDLLKGKPMWSLSKKIQDSSGRICEIRLEGEFLGDDKKPLDYVNGIYSCMTFSETSFISEMFGKNDKYDYVVINTGDVVVFDFNYPCEKRQEIIDAGYKTTMEYFKSSLNEKKQKVYSVYKKIYSNLSKVQNMILRKKYVIAKNILAELFILLSDERNIIDESLYKAIKIFQNLLFSNVKAGLLGYSICENISVVKSQLTLVMDNLDLRIKEFDEYFMNFSV